MRTYHPNNGSKLFTTLTGSQTLAEAGADSLKSLLIISLGMLTFSILFASTYGVDLSPGFF